MYFWADYRSQEGVTRGESHQNSLVVSLLPSVVATSIKSKRKYKLFETPLSQEAMEDFCFQVLGQGSMFCIRKNCSIAHHIQEVMTFIPGDGYVKKIETPHLSNPQ